MLNSTLAAVDAAAGGEALTVAREAGVDLDALVRVVAASSGASTMLELEATPMRERLCRGGRAGRALEALRHRGEPTRPGSPP
ncbi:MAG TPA: NAD-binding protein [Thermoleophilaceae bacterium]|nr:NAD-binding protein [Thermoleophilaceae bacterium]